MHQRGSSMCLLRISVHSTSKSCDRSDSPSFIAKNNNQMLQMKNLLLIKMKSDFVQKLKSPHILQHVEFKSNSVNIKTYALAPLSLWIFFQKRNQKSLNDISQFVLRYEKEAESFPPVFKPYICSRMIGQARNAPSCYT